MKRAEAIDMIKLINTYLTAGNPMWNVEVVKEACDKAIEALKQTEWIPVSKRMPDKEEKSYWVCLYGGGQCQCRWTNNMFGLGSNEWSDWGWHVMDKPQYSRVIAWMPLPEPYKAGEQ